MSSATVHAWPEQAGAFTRLRLKFRSWRRTRPFWGGLLAMIAGLPILYFPYAHLSIGGLTVAMATTGGAGSLVIGLLLIALGLTSWFQPLVRIFCGVATSVLALISIPVSNLGGFGAGLIAGLLGGGLLVSWAPLKVQPEGLAESVTDEPEQAAEEPAVIEHAVAEHAAAEEAAGPGEQR
ncbi:hypothetical protein GCM10010193_20510 [Kitasatospora atroaurantiaca]|uniref:Integral membrane protein n=1 Tax=Kitasatospora atroaurantiaca TaxID=285545 RepID=A0A561EVB1_9ACTN|nr:DUF6114 domain-containing protein [Kitasatospora atroaurantiaca]TWE19554.1 hypothetical protein FB465_4672 [Kitasatospora atroaurantiaca]